jgi:hypothetical protein
LILPNFVSWVSFSKFQGTVTEKEKKMSLEKVGPPKDQFDEDSFYIPDAGDGISLIGHKKKCIKCGRRILVQLPMFGVPHHFDASVCCCDCLEIDEGFKKEHPEIAEDLAKWKILGQDD